MKIKNILSVAALSMLVIAMVIISCKKENSIPPTITLNQPNENPWTIYLQANVTDPGATAVDNSGNSLTTSIVSDWNNSNPDQNSIGTYTITYFVSDAAGNTASTTRTVIVINPAPFVQGNYTVTDILSGDTSAIANYAVTVAQSSTVDDGITIANFGGFGASVNVLATLNASNDSLTISPQSPAGMIRTPVTNGLHGSGTFNSTGILKINYTIVYSGTPNDTINGTATYTRVVKKK
ncbi:MAG: immunoglobulin-like domain-containing protein [Bacteroidales bacterium]|jgi:hypothetical protein